MFEKEAEKYATVDLPDGYTKIDYQKKVDWQKGAEFGYNKAKVEVEDSYRESICNSELNLASITEQLEELEKANEWHCVKDGDLPKEEGEYLCAFDFHKRYALDIEFIFINNEGKHYFDNLAWDINKLVAWKEIVLPELKESE